MSEEPDKAIPSKCTRCAKPMSTPLVCDYCRALNPIPAMLDYFTLLGVRRRFDLDADELRRKFLELNRHTHPDYHGEESSDVQQLSLRVSAGVNDAYRTLGDRAARAAYLLELLGGASSADDKSVPDGFLETMVMMQEDLAAAVAISDNTEVSHLRNVLQTQRDGLLHRIGGLFGDLDDAVACEAVRKDLLGEIRKQLNAVSYVKKLLSMAK